MRYGYKITYTSFDGGKTTVGSDGHDSFEEARNCTLEMAKRDGWTPPKWWQWWRWRDTRIK